LQEETQKEGWHLDKKVPISIIATLFINVVYFTWATNEAYNELKNVKSDVSKIESRVKEYEGTYLRAADRLTALEKQLEYTNKTLDKIWFKMETQVNGSRTNGQTTIP